MMAEVEPAARFQAFRARLPELTRLILKNGGRVPETIVAFAMLDLTAYWIQPPSSTIRGDAKLYRKCAALLSELEERIEFAGKAAATLGTLHVTPEIRYEPVRVIQGSPFCAYEEIAKALRSHMDEFKPAKATGRPEARDFVMCCCHAAQTVEEETGIPAIRGGRINPAMIDIVTEIMRPVPAEARLWPTLTDGIDRLDDPERKGVQMALRKGREQGRLS